MTSLVRQREAFRAVKSFEASHAGQVAAARLVAGIDLDEALGAGPEALRGIIGRVVRTLERERLKGFRQHWSYDLNRHIALKQALLRLQERAGARGDGPDRDDAPVRKQNGARRRR